MFFILLISFALSGPTAGADQGNRAIFTVDQKIYTANGQSFSMDTAPFISENRAFVPVRFLANTLGIADKDITWDEKTQAVTLTSRGDRTITVKLQVGSNTLVVSNGPGQGIAMDVSPVIKNSRTFLPARWVAEAFGFEVGWDDASQAVLIGSPGDLLAPLPDNSWSVRYEQKVVQSSSGDKTADLIYVNMNNPSVSLKPVQAQDMVGGTESLASMANRAGAVAAINGSFFNAYSGGDMMPQGTVEINGIYYHLGSSGTLGVDENNRVHIGNCRPSVKGSTNDSWVWPNSWYAWGINNSNPDGIEVFTPFYRDGVTPPSKQAVTVVNGVVTTIGSGTVSIPNDGYVIWYGESSNERPVQFALGKKVAYKVVFNDNDNGPVFKECLSNDPLLLANGETVPNSVNDPKMDIEAPRSFVGVTGNNTLVLGTVASANIRELAELAQNLGLKDALNLDGGASSGLFYNGDYVTQPGRQLSNCLAVLID